MNLFINDCMWFSKSPKINICFAYRKKYGNFYLMNYSKFKCKIDVKKMRNQINNVKSFDNTKNSLSLDALEIVKIYNEIKTNKSGIDEIIINNVKVLIKLIACAELNIISTDLV